MSHLSAAAKAPGLSPKKSAIVPWTLGHLGFVAKVVALYMATGTGRELTSLCSGCSGINAAIAEI